MAGEAAANGWILDRHIPIALIGALVLQTAGVAWWAASIDARLTAVERAATGMDETREAITRLDEKLSGMKDLVQRIDRRTEQLEERKMR